MRRRNYKRDAKGRFARVSGSKGKSGKAAKWKKRAKAVAKDPMTYEAVASIALGVYAANSMRKTNSRVKASRNAPMPSRNVAAHVNRTMSKRPKPTVAQTHANLMTGRGEVNRRVQAAEAQRKKAIQTSRRAGIQSSSAPTYAWNSNSTWTL